MGHGMGSSLAPMTAAVMNSVGPQRAGLGSAMTNTSREVGGVLGIALLGAILTTQLKDAFGPAISQLGLTAQQLTTIGDAAKHGSLDVSSMGLDPATQAAITTAFNDAFMKGFHPALIFAGSVLLVAAVVANRFIPGRHTVDLEHAAEEPSAEPVAVEI
jgi:hypothetical protein